MALSLTTFNYNILIMKINDIKLTYEDQYFPTQFQLNVEKNIFPHTWGSHGRWPGKACDSEKIIVLFRENSDLVSNIYEVFNLPVLHSNLSAQYEINHRYIGVTYDETKTIATMGQQYIDCQHANGQFCRINAPFQPFTTPPSCVIALYAKNDQATGKQCSLSIPHVSHTFIPVAATSNLWIIPSNPETLGSTITKSCSDKATSTVTLQQPFHILGLSSVCNATSRYFHLPLHITRITLWWWIYLWIPPILMQLPSQPQTLGYGNISTVTGPHPTCRN